MKPRNDWKVWAAPLPTLDKVSDLIHFGTTPYLSHFRSSSGDSYIYHFCESEEGSSRWLVFRVQDEALNAYVERRKDLRGLIHSAADVFVYYLDLDSLANQIAAYYAPFDTIPDAYMPPEGLLYDGVPIASSVDVLALSKKYGSSILNLHLKSQGARRMIGYGTARISKFADIISNLDDLTKEYAQDRYVKLAKAGADLKAIRDRIFTRDEFGFEMVAFSPTGSLNVVLKPAMQEQPLFTDDPTIQGQITEEILTMLNTIVASASIDESFRDRYGEDVIQAAAQFVAALEKDEIGVDLSYGDATVASRPLRVSRISARTASLMSTKLKQATRESMLVTLDGVFTALNARTRLYEFVGSTGDESVGHLRANLRPELKKIKPLTKSYRVIIDRKLVQSASKGKPERQDFIREISPIRQRLKIDIDELIGLKEQAQEDDD